jgi:hypothetical protein
MPKKTTSPFKQISIKLIVFIISVFFLGCSKKENLYTREAISAFEAQVYSKLAQKLVNSNVCLVDSNFYFHNLSTGGQDVTYHWDFGDGTSSDLFTPKHIYNTFGRYKVKLTITLGSGQSAIYEKELLVIAGQKRISLGTLMSTGIVDLVETDDDRFFLFGWSKDLSNFPPPEKALMMVLDKNLRKLSQVYFPKNYRFGTATAANDGNFILCGTTSGNESNNELLKINREGTVLWSKKINTDANFSDALPIADGYLLTGTKRDDKGKKLLISVKTDFEGNVVWNHLYKDQEFIENPGNTVKDGENYVTGGLVRANQNVCTTCDSLSLIRFNAHGVVLNRSIVPLISGTKNYSFVYLAKLDNGGFVTAATNARGLFTFSNDLKPILQTNVLNDISHLSVTSTGQMVLLTQEYNNGQRVVYVGLDQSGATQWQYTMDSMEFIPNGSRCCTNSSGIKTYPLKNGGSIFIANEMGEKSDYRIMVSKISVDGTLM